MAEGFEAEGALLDCFDIYPHFYNDLELLVQEGYAKVTSPSTCIWLKSKTSLAEYFKWANGDTYEVPGGYWSPIEKAFKIKRHSLRRLAGNNGNPCKPDESKDFKKIKPILEKHRIQEDIRSKEQWLYNHIKRLFLFSDESPETIRKILLRLNTIFKGNVDKNKQNRRLINSP